MAPPHTTALLDVAPRGSSLLVVSDLHLRPELLDWVADRARAVDVVVIAGDLLEAAGGPSADAQAAIARSFVASLGEHATVVVASGNHDLDGVDADGERCSRWNGELAGLAHVDGEFLELGDTVISVCPWWDGPIGAGALRRQLELHAERVAGRRWVWVHHAPAAGSPTAWDGRRDCGDAVLSELIAQHRPALVLSGHVHQAPFIEGGHWFDDRDGTVLCNAGQQRGSVPTHLLIELDEGVVTWSSEVAVERRSLSPARQLVLAA